MIKSMTGFGRAEINKEGITVLCEIKAVNHRYFEFSLRAPRNCQFLEDRLKKTVSGKVSRGKVDMSINITLEKEVGSEIIINREFTDGYVAAVKTLAKDYRLKNDFTVSALASNPDVFTVRKRELDEELLTSVVLEAAESALDKFIEMRKSEGVALAADVMGRAKTILENVEKVEERSPETVKEYSEKLKQKIRDLLEGHEADEQRIITEVGIFADKVAVAEETVRLRSHFDQLEALLNGDGEAGRKLDFLLQEMNRETNTIGSKAQDVTIARIVIDIKAELEKIREQIQNIE